MLNREDSNSNQNFFKGNTTHTLCHTYCLYMSGTELVDNDSNVIDKLQTTEICVKLN